MIGNAIYSTRREEEGYGGFRDLTESYTNLATMKKGLKSALGAQDSKIIEMRDVNFA